MDEDYTWAFCTGPILIWEGKVVFTENKMNTDLMVTNIEDKNSLNNEEREILITQYRMLKIPINIEQQKVKETNSMV